MSIGVVGAGNMGSAIVGRLALGADVLVYDRDTDRAGALATDRVRAVADLGELGGCRIVLLSLPTEAASEDVVASLGPRLAPGSVVVETSTVSPGLIVKHEGILAAGGVHFIDAAILSGVELMQAGTTTLLIGGKAEAVAAAAPALELLTPNRTLLGSAGAGVAAKVVNNAVSHAVMVVLVEALSVAKKSGVDLKVMTDLLAAPDGGLLRPLTYRIVERVFSADYEGGMPTDAARKDSELALALAQRHHVPLFAVQAAHTAYELASAAGLGREDYAAIAKLWEEWTGSPLRAD